MTTDSSHPYPFRLAPSKLKIRLAEELLQFKLSSEWVLFILKSLSCFSVGRHLDLSSSLPLVPVWHHSPTWRQNIPTVLPGVRITSSLTVALAFRLIPFNRKSSENKNSLEKENKKHTHDNIACIDNQHEPSKCRLKHVIVTYLSDCREGAMVKNIFPHLNADTTIIG